MTARIFIHVGLPKTATTTLQFELFPTVPGIVYLGAKGIVRTPPPLVDAARRVVRAVTLRAREIAAGEPLSAALRNACDLILAIDGTVVISEERWTGAAVELDYAPGEYAPMALSRLFGDAWSAIVVLREPIALAASWLLQTMLKRPLWWRMLDGTLNLIGPREALEWHLARAETNPRSIFRTGCRFDAEVARYRAAVGDDRLHLLAYERLFETDDSCRRAFAGVLGVPADGPPLGRRNEASADKRREIARRHLRRPEDGERIEAFVVAWADAHAIVAAHPAVRAFVERHALDPWRAVAGIPGGGSERGRVLPAPWSEGSVASKASREDTA